MNRDFDLPHGSAFSTVPRLPPLLTHTSAWRWGYPSWFLGWYLSPRYMHLAWMFSTANIGRYFPKNTSWAFSPQMQPLKLKKYLLYSLPFFLMSSHCHYLSSLFLLCSWYFPWGDTPDRWGTQQQAPGTLTHMCTSALFSPSCPFWSSVSAAPWQLLCSFLKFSTLEASYFCTASCGLVHTTLDTITLILGNPKMKQNAKKLLLHRKCCQWERTLIQSKNWQFSELTVPAMPP